MADGRHFENRFISISQSWIIRFRSNLVHRYKFPFWACTFDKKNRNFSNSRWRTDAILNIVFWLYLDSRRTIGRSTRNSVRRWRITCQYRSRDQTTIFQNSRWRTAAILKIALFPYLCCEVPISIKYVTCGCKFPFRAWKFDNFSNWRWRTDGCHNENRFWLCIGAILADLCKFQLGDEESHADIGHLTKTAIFENSRWRTAAILIIALTS